MRISLESRARIESFLKERLGDESLRLPPTSVHVGWFARLLMKVLGMGAITFGRHVFVARSLVSRGDGGQVFVPGWLLVHEMVHVLQYQEKGYIRFFFDYLRGYWRALREGGRFDRSGRMSAYFSIAEERAAHEAEHAYREAREKIQEAGRQRPLW